MDFDEIKFFKSQLIHQFGADKSLSTLSADQVTDCLVTGFATLTLADAMTRLKINSIHKKYVYEATKHLFTIPLCQLTDDEITTLLQGIWQALGMDIPF